MKAFCLLTVGFLISLGPSLTSAGDDRLERQEPRVYADRTMQRILDQGVIISPTMNPQVERSMQRALMQGMQEDLLVSPLRKSAYSFSLNGGETHEM